MLINSGQQAADLRTLELVDADGNATPFLRPDGEEWATSYGPRGLELSQDLDRALLYSTYFGEVSLEHHDLVTGEITELLELASNDAIPGQNHISAWDVTPDFSHVAIVFDDIAADPGGFRILGSFVYVIEVDTGRTWRANVDAHGRTLAFEGDGFSGFLLEHVSLSPDASWIVFGDGYTTHRSLWTEVLP